MQLFVKQTSGERFEVSCEPTDTVGRLKECIEELKSELAKERQRLIYAGRVLNDTDTIESSQIVDGHTIHLVLGRAPKKPSTPSTPSSPASTSANSNTNASNTNANTTNANTTNTNAAPPAANNPFGGMFGAGATGGGLGGAGLGAGVNPNEMLNNPELMGQMLNNPLMEQLMTNPEVMQSLMEQDPRMREMMERNPQLGHAMRDPQTLRQVFEVMRNPNAMREMMRSNDIAMRNLDAVPGGFNHLRQMFTDVNGNGTGGARRSQTDERPVPAPGQDTGEAHDALPNPWGGTNNNNGGGGGGGAAATAANNPFAAFGATGAGATSAAPGATGAAAGGMGGMANIFENPAVQGMLRETMSNPETMQQMMNNNPLMQQFLQNNPEARNTLNDPDYWQRMMQPENIQAMMQMQQAMGQLQRAGLLPQSPLGAAGGAGANPFAAMGGGMGGAGGGANPFAQMFGAGGAGVGAGAGAGAGAPASGDTRPARERYAEQLQQLADMGFVNEEFNIQILEQVGGNVNLAIERLFSD